MKKFPSEKALSKYTLANHKIFPRGNVHAGGLLRALLRRILHPPDEPEKQALARNNRQKHSKNPFSTGQGSSRVGDILDILQPATEQRLAAIRANALLAAKSRLERLDQNTISHN